MNDSLGFTTTVSVEPNQDLLSIQKIKNLVREECGNYYYNTLYEEKGLVQMKVELLFNSGGEGNQIQIREEHGVNNNERWQDVVFKVAWECSPRYLNQLIIMHTCNVTVTITVY